MHVLEMSVMHFLDMVQNMLCMQIAPSDMDGACPLFYFLLSLCLSSAICSLLRNILVHARRLVLCLW